MNPVSITNQCTINRKNLVKERVFIPYFRTITFLLIIISFFTSNSQEVEKYYSSWNTIDIHKNINETWSVNTEINIRRTDFLKKWEQLIVRPFIHYKLEKDLELSIAYSYVENNNFSQFRPYIDFKEHNIFQQIIIKHLLSKFSFQHRVRLEERFKQNITEINSKHYIIDGTDYSNRLRYKFQIVVPLKSLVSNKVLNLVIYDELHLDFGDGFRPEGVDQNRFNISLSFSVSNNFEISSGFHNIYFIRSDRNLNNRILETKIVFKI